MSRCGARIRRGASALVGAALACAIGVAPAAEAAPVRAGLFAGDPVALTLAVEVGEGWTIESAAGISPGAVRGAVVMLGLTRDLMAPLLDLHGGGIRPTLGLGMRLAFSRAVLSAETSEVLAGVRVPAGLAWRRQDVEVFVEAAPGVDFGARARMSIEGGVGVRLSL